MPSLARSVRPACLPALGLLALSSGAQAQDGGVSIELNKLEAAETACQAYVVVENAEETAFEAFSIDLVAFDGAGVISKRLAVDLAPLRAGKTSVKVFGLAGVDCADVGRLLINGVLDCRDAQGRRADCHDLVRATSKAAAPLIN